MLSIVPKVKAFLSERLGLGFHDGKLQLTSIWHGVEFLGAWLKPFRVYVSRNCVGRINRKLDMLASKQPEKWYASLNSYCGLLSHWNNFNVRQILLLKRHHFTRYGMFDFCLRHYYPVRSDLQSDWNDYKHLQCETKYGILAMNHGRHDKKWETR